MGGGFKGRDRVTLLGCLFVRFRGRVRVGDSIRGV